MALIARISAVFTLNRNHTIRTPCQTGFRTQHTNLFIGSAGRGNFSVPAPDNLNLFLHTMIKFNWSICQASQNQ